jgi:hypothetical protein
MYTPQEKCFPWVANPYTVLHVTFPCPVKQGITSKPNQQKIDAYDMLYSMCTIVGVKTEIIVHGTFLSYT